MSTVNEQGKNYNFVAIADRRFDYGMLSEAPVFKIDEIGKIVANASTETNISAESRTAFILIDSCLYKLQGVLYHLRNIKNIKENLLTGLKEQLKNKDVRGLTICYLEKELVFEFEALILQARACLDALTFLITKRLPGHQVNFFSKLKNALENSKKSESNEKIIGLLKDSKWLFESEVLMGKSPTRSYVAHYGSLLTMQECCMTISGIEEGKVLIFDLEFRKSIPVMNTASKILEFVPYFVINTLSTLCELIPVQKKEFSNDLCKEFIILSKETVEQEKGVKVGVIKEMDRVNFIINDCYISKDALSKALDMT
ncbi:MAG: hypothetical protein FIB08_08185 [Candidatus Methanoperedens sp.]|nr:hypothetical protein [Candidatus Methanoperedens sp.]